MITSRKELHLYLDADRFALGKADTSIGALLIDSVWRFEVYLRWYEYLSNRRKIAESPLRLIVGALLKSLSYKLGFSIPINCFGPGLRINHYGLLVVNSLCRVGKWCDIHQGVNIGDNSEIIDDRVFNKVPVIGDYCFIGPGAAIFGNITVGNEVSIGANSIINKSIVDGMTAIGNPMVAYSSDKKHNTIASKAFECEFVKRFPQYKNMI